MAGQEIPITELCERFMRVYTGAITDVLDEMGIYHRTLPHTLQPLVPGTKMAGVAFPVYGTPNYKVDYQTSIRKVLTMLGEAPRDAVLVYQTNDSVSAHLGELSVTSLKVRGCRGAVIDGGVRDVEFILREGFPVFARYKTPTDCIPRWELLERNCSIIIGDVRIAPGDVIVADHDGIVAVPKEVAVEVLFKGEEVVNTENQVREMVRRGMMPLEAYERYGRF